MFGVQADGSVRGILNDQDKLLNELNAQSIQILLDMGYDFDLTVQALLALREARNYNPVGEVQKAIDWIDRKRERDAIDQAKAVQRQA